MGTIANKSGAAKHSGDGVGDHDEQEQRAHEPGTGSEQPPAQGNKPAKCYCEQQQEDSTCYAILKEQAQQQQR